MMSIMAILLAGCLIALSQSTGHIDIYVGISIFIFSAAFLFDIHEIPVYKKYVIPLSMGYFFRIVLLLYDVYTDNPLHLPLVGGALSSDPLRFYNAAIGYAHGETTSYGGVFPKLLGFIFSITGISRLWAEFIVLLFSELTILAFVNTVDKLDIPMRDRITGTFLISLLPNFAFLSAVLRRETVISFIVALSIKYFIDWMKDKGGNKSFILAFVFSLVASLFHGATGLIAVGFVFIRVIYNPQKKCYTIETKSVFSAFVFFAIFLLIYARYGNVFFTKVESMLSAGTLASTRDAGGSSYAQYVGDARTPLRTLIFAIPRLMYFMFSPFPWQWRGIGDVLTFILSSCVYLYIIINSIRYVRYTSNNEENRNIVIALLIIALIGAVVFSWGVTNTGTATRHRDKFISIYAILFSLCYGKRPRISLK